MSKSNKTSTTTEFFKQLLDQIAGTPHKDKPLIPEYRIEGEGDFWCYDPAERAFKKVSRGIIVYVMKEDYDYKGRTLVYTNDGLTLCVEPDELSPMGMN